MRAVLRAEEHGVTWYGNTRSRNWRPTDGVEVAAGTEISITNSYSIGVDGVFKEVVGAGLSYSWSITTTTSKSVTHTMKDDDTKHLTNDEKLNTLAR
jgi:hypothetical protein